MRILFGEADTVVAGPLLLCEIPPGERTALAVLRCRTACPDEDSAHASTNRGRTTRTVGHLPILRP
ncbi:MAG: hypothetical protein ACOVT5_00545, partial [Armatimonadaceae bacterium]